MAAAMIRIFLMIYWPSSVGTKNPDQVTAGKNSNGIIVVIMWMNRRGMTTRSVPRIRNRIPIRHSNSPKSTMKVPNDMSKGNVAVKSCSTSGLAGDRSRTLRMPNQKNTTKRPMRATGTLSFLNAWISSISNVRRDMHLLYIETCVLKIGHIC